MQMIEGNYAMGGRTVNPPPRYARPPFLSQIWDRKGGMVRAYYAPFQTRSQPIT